MQGAKSMRSKSGALTGAAFACALALAGMGFPVGEAAAAEGKGDPAPAARTIPVAPIDPASTAGRIVLAIAEGLEERVGSGSETVRLALAAPMRAEERHGTVTVHLPGARLTSAGDSRRHWELGDLAIAVTPRSETAYDFETALPPTIDRRNERLAIGENAISGTWRSDLETTTALDVAAANIRLLLGDAPPRAREVSLGALAATEEMAQEADGLWDGRFSFSLSDLEAPSVSLGSLDVTGSFEDVESDLILAADRDVDVLADNGGGPEALLDALAPLLSARWGRSDATITMHDLSVIGDELELGGRSVLTLGQLIWFVEFDGRKDLSELATRITVSEPHVGEVATGTLAPALIPRDAAIDVVLSGLPLRRIIESLAAPEQEAAPGRGAMLEELLALMDAADTSLRILDIHAAGPSYRLDADGRFHIEPAGAFGVIGRIDVLVRGVDSLMALAAAEGDEAAMGVFLLLQGLGRPVLEAEGEAPAYAYELDLRRDGAATVNGIPLDILY